MVFICNTGKAPSTLTPKALTENISVLNTADLLLD